MRPANQEKIVRHVAQMTRGGAAIRRALAVRASCAPLRHRPNAISVGSCSAREFAPRVAASARRGDVQVLELS
jgi:hypothetical protein